MPGNNMIKARAARAARLKARGEQCTLCVRLPAPLMERLRAAAAAEMRCVGNFVAITLTRALDAASSPPSGGTPR